MNTLAIDIGGTKFSMAVFAGSRMVKKITRSTDREGGREWMLKQLVTITREWKSEFVLSLCAIGFGGPVDFQSQTIALSTHVGGWSNFDLPGFLQAETALPAIIDNDANVGALGESFHGAGKGCDPMFYMTLSTGIGGGFVSGGKLYRGADSYAGEIGHLAIRPDGPQCVCGAYGCYERMCGGMALEAAHGRSAKELLQDPEFVKSYVVDLALGLKTCIMLLNPQRIVIGGGIAKAGEILFTPLREELGRQITSWSHARINVVPAELGDDSVLWGALALCQEYDRNRRKAEELK